MDQDARDRLENLRRALDDIEQVATEGLYTMSWDEIREAREALGHAVEAWVAEMDNRYEREEFRERVHRAAEVLDFIHNRVPGLT
ncbi:MAG TPA: hypothetical protein VE975_02195 [Actinomycetota bacterium]|jgi:hypothetical protein|nr:hypothetical protein [Actinomycetota bacterium]